MCDLTKFSVCCGAEKCASAEAGQRSHATSTHFPRATARRVRSRVFPSTHMYIIMLLERSGSLRRCPGCRPSQPCCPEWGSKWWAPAPRHVLLARAQDASYREHMLWKLCWHDTEPNKCHLGGLRWSEPAGELRVDAISGHGTSPRAP